MTAVTRIYTPHFLCFFPFFSLSLSLCVLFMSFFFNPLQFTVVFYSYTAFAPVATITIIATANTTATTYSRLRQDGMSVILSPVFSFFSFVLSAHLFLFVADDKAICM